MMMVPEKPSEYQMRRLSAFLASLKVIAFSCASAASAIATSYGGGEASLMIVAFSWSELASLGPRPPPGRLKMLGIILLTREWWAIVV